MKSDVIEKFLTSKKEETNIVQVSFKSRPAVNCLFVEAKDFKELGRKNLWRVVSENNIDAYNEAQSINLTRIFNGMDFTKLKWVESAVSKN